MSDTMMRNALTPTLVSRQRIVLIASPLREEATENCSPTRGWKGFVR